MHLLSRESSWSDSHLKIMLMISCLLLRHSIGQSMGLGTQDSKKYRNIWTLGIAELF